MSMSTMWLILLIAFIVAEAATSFAMVSIWFCLGAIVAIIAARAGASFVWQFTLFVVVSVASLLLAKPFVKRINLRKEATNLDAIIGGVAMVTEAISNVDEKGWVKIDGKLWTARSIDGSVIEEGTKVKVIKIQGVKLFVEKI